MNVTGMTLLCPLLALTAFAEVDIDRLCPPRPETAAPFRAEICPPAARPYRQAALDAYRYMVSLPAMTVLVETGRPNQRYQHNAYVAKTHAAHVMAMLDWAKSRALGNMLTRVQKPSGRIPTFWAGTFNGDTGTSAERYDWLNCMAASAKALVQLSAAADKGAARRHEVAGGSTGK